jgi:hypothetical protein
MQTVTVVYDLGGLAEWLSAIGTIAATFLALWLALRDDSERLAFSVHAYRGALDIIVFNSGTKPLVLRDVDFQVGRFRSEGEHSIESILAGRGLPTKLAPGENFTHNYPLSYEPSYLPDRLYELASSKVPWNRQLYFVATTGSGQRIRYRISSHLRRSLVQKGVRR